MFRQILNKWGWLPVCLAGWLPRKAPCISDQTIKERESPLADHVIQTRCQGMLFLVNNLIKAQAVLPLQSLIKKTILSVFVNLCLLDCWIAGTDQIVFLIALSRQHTPPQLSRLESQQKLTALFCFLQEMALTQACTRWSGRRTVRSTLSRKSKFRTCQTGRRKTPWTRFASWRRSKTPSLRPTSRHSSTSPQTRSGKYPSIHVCLCPLSPLPADLIPYLSIVMEFADDGDVFQRICECQNHK